MYNETIFITGIGIISALENSIDETFQALSDNRINTSKIDVFECDIDKPVFQANLPDPSSILLEKGSAFKISEKIFNPFIFIEEL